MKRVACCLIVVAVVLTADAFVLAERGRSAVCAVDVKAAGESAAYAADELTNYVARLTGVELPIGGAAERKVFLEAGEADLGEDGFEIAENKGTLHIRGGKRGLVYGVYELLERFGGVGFFSSWHEVVPHLDRLEIPEETKIREKPAFDVRVPFWADAIWHPAFAVKIRKNCETWATIPEKMGGMRLHASRRYRGHTFDLLVPWQEFGKSHPEYFSEVNGCRKIRESQLCLTNPDVLRLVTERLREQMRRETEADCFSLQPNDWFNYCTCSNCAAVAKEEGSESGPYVRFAQAVARGLIDEFPDKLLHVGAYQWYRRPPKKFKRFAPNILFDFAPSECDFARPITESSFPANVDAKADLEAWSQIAPGGFMVFDYSTAFSDYMAAFPNLKAIAGNLRWYRKLGVVNVTNEGQHNGYGAPFAELKAWLGGKLMWNPDQPVEPLVERFLVGYYGKGAPFVLQYLRALEALPRDPIAQPLSCSLETACSEVLSDAFVDESLSLWDLAEAAVTDDAATLHNVQLGKLPVVYTFLKRKFPLILASTDPSRLEKCRARATWAVAFLEREPRPIAFSEKWDDRDARRTLRFSTWKRLAEEGTARAADGVTEEKAFAFVTHSGWVRLAKDPSASGGEAAKLATSGWEWCLQLKARDVTAEKGVRYRVRVRARVDFRAGAPRRGIALSGGYQRGGDRAAQSFQGKVRSCDMTEAYAWYDLGAWTPSGKDDGYFWLSSGWFDRNRSAAHPDIAALWIDQFALVAD